jgi:hypothetical protein
MMIRSNEDGVVYVAVIMVKHNSNIDQLLKKIYSCHYLIARMVQ